MWEVHYRRDYPDLPQALGIAPFLFEPDANEWVEEQKQVAGTGGDPFTFLQLKWVDD